MDLRGDFDNRITKAKTTKTERNLKLKRFCTAKKKKKLKLKNKNKDKKKTKHLLKCKKYLHTIHQIKEQFSRSKKHLQSSMDKNKNPTMPSNTGVRRIAKAVLQRRHRWSIGL